MTQHAISEYPPGSVNAIEFGCRCPTCGTGDDWIVTVADCPLHSDAHEERYKADEREGIIGADVCEVD